MNASLHTWDPYRRPNPAIPMRRVRTHFLRGGWCQGRINRKDITMNKIINYLLLVGPHKIIVGISI